MFVITLSSTFLKKLFIFWNTSGFIEKLHICQNLEINIGTLLSTKDFVQITVAMIQSQIPDCIQLPAKKKKILFLSFLFFFFCQGLTVLSTLEYSGYSQKQSQCTTASSPWAQAVLLPQPPEQMGFRHVPQPMVAIHFYFKWQFSF